jgi:hypothetical protein
MKKSNLNEAKRMQQLAGIIKESQVNERYPSQVWDWDITEFGKYNPETNTFRMKMDDDAKMDYMDTEFPGYMDDEDISEEGNSKFIEDVRKAVEEEYGPGVRIEGFDFD